MVTNVCPFLEPDRWVSQVFGSGAGWGAGPVLPTDAYRDGEHYVVEFDLPGVDPSAIELGIDRHQLTVRAQRQPMFDENDDVLIAERPAGEWTRQLTLGEALDTEQVQAHYTDGVLRLEFPVRADAKPRRIEVSAGRHDKALTS